MRKEGGQKESRRKVKRVREKGVSTKKERKREIARRDRENEEKR